MSKKLENNTGIPDFNLEAVARMLLPKIQKLFESEERPPQCTETISESA